MTDRHAPDYPNHDRTSCLEDNPKINATAAGSTGCARCTALLLERDAEVHELLADYVKSSIRGRLASPQQNKELIVKLLEQHGLR